MPALAEITTAGHSQAIAGLELRARTFESMDARLEAASDFIYEETRHRFDTEGEGEWAPLADSTVAAKISQGYSDPARILYAEGNLYESATSPNGPYSERLLAGERFNRYIVMLVDWENGGWQIPTVLAEGNDRLPARPIWPPPERVQDEVARILTKGL